jgi:hypothetical protein
MARKMLIWVGVTLEIAAVIAVFGRLLADAPAAQAVLLTLAIILGFCGLSMQVLAAEVGESERS